MTRTPLHAFLLSTTTMVAAAASATATASVRTVLLAGRDAFGGLCHVELEFDTGNQLTGLLLSGHFVGPAVLAMPHGDDQPERITDQLTFDSRFNSWTALQVTTAADGSSLIAAHGPSFWHASTDATVVAHQISLQPSLMTPTAVHYASQQPYGYARNWVGTVELQCDGLHAVVSGH